ncbi:MarR family winged helix-turn-helix transcriptional regulator [Nocardia pneumoniae]|uniref:MarR family winged helix-turn-helix transcriptional regulator n=1 Tax=Nocardia pneumoniae TaxID=228601 RepID=UPI0007C66E77|nr:MarR family transcriptional regulator [Nocardia pneumoniae]
MTQGSMSSPEHLSNQEYSRLLAFRAGLRQFLRGSERRAAVVGLTDTQHQLLLAIRGHPGPDGPSIGEVAGYLDTRHHSVVQLIDRTEQLGLVTRNRGQGKDRRVVRLTLTEAGKEILARLSATHLQELQRLAPLISALIDPPALPQAGECCPVRA